MLRLNCVGKCRREGTDMKKGRKFLLYFFRAIVLVVAGFALELGTSYFSELINGVIDKNAAGLLISMIIVGAIATAYFVIASTARPIRSLDNDIWGPAAILVVVIMSFSENFLAGLFDCMAPNNLACAVIWIVIGALLIGFDIFFIDKQYEKIEGEVQFIFNKQINAVENCKRLENKLDDMKGYLVYQRIYNKKIVMFKVWAVVIVVLILLACFLWATKGLLWGI